MKNVISTTYHNVGKNLAVTYYLIGHDPENGREKYLSLYLWASNVAEYSLFDKANDIWSKEITLAEFMELAGL